MSSLTASALITIFPNSTRLRLTAFWAAENQRGSWTDSTVNNFGVAAPIRKVELDSLNRAYANFSGARIAVLN